MNSLDIYNIKDINDIINSYQKQINHINSLVDDLYNYRLYFIRNSDDLFKNIYVNIDNKNFIILIDNNNFYERKNFNRYFHNLCEIRRLKLFYIFIDILLQKYYILDFDIKLFKIFNKNIFNFLFDDYKNLTIKNNFSFDYMFSFKLINCIQKEPLNDNLIISILDSLKKNTNTIIKNRRYPKSFF